MSFARSVPSAPKDSVFRPNATVRPPGAIGPLPLWAAVAVSVVLLALLVSRMDALPALALTMAGLGGMVLLLAVPFAGVLLGVFILITNLPAGLAEHGLIPQEATALMGVLFVPALVMHLVARREDLRLDGTFGLMVILLAVMLVSTYFAVDVPRALSYIGRYAAEGMAVFFLVLNTVRDRTALTRVLAVVVGAAAFLASLSIYQAMTGDYGQEFLGLAQRTTEGIEDRARGPTDDANRYAQILLMAGCFALAFFWNLNGRARAAAVGACGLILVAIFLTYSRGAFVTFVPLVAVLAALRIIPLRHLVIAITVGILLVPVIAPGYMDRIHTIAGAAGLVSADAQVEPDGATRGRTTVMLAALLAYSEYPILGVGPHQYVEHHSLRYVQRPEVAYRAIATNRRVHNLYLEIAVELGTVGLLVFLAIPVLLLRNLWRIRKRARSRHPDIERLAVGFILAIVSYLGTGIFLHLAFQRYYWFLVAITAAAVWILREDLEADERDEWVAHPQLAQVFPTLQRSGR